MLYNKFERSIKSGSNCEATNNLGQRPCTMSTLQKLVRLIATSESSLSTLNSLSSTALYNFLMLVEQNVQFFQSDYLSDFVKVIDINFRIGCKDDWCSFLIGRLKKHVVLSNPSDLSCSGMEEMITSEISSESIQRAIDSDPSLVSNEEEFQAHAGNTSIVKDIVEGAGSSEGEKKEDIVANQTEDFSAGKSNILNIISHG